MRAESVGFIVALLEKRYFMEKVISLSSFYFYKSYIKYFYITYTT